MSADLRISPSSPNNSPDPVVPFALAGFLAATERQKGDFLRENLPSSLAGAPLSTSMEDVLVQARTTFRDQAVQSYESGVYGNITALDGFFQISAALIKFGSSSTSLKTKEEIAALEAKTRNCEELVGLTSNNYVQWAARGCLSACGALDPLENFSSPAHDSNAAPSEARALPSASTSTILTSEDVYL